MKLLSSLWDRAASRLAALRFNPSRKVKWALLAIGFLGLFIVASVRGHSGTAALWIGAATFCLYRIEHEG